MFIEKEDENNDKTEYLNQKKQQNNENKAQWILLKQNFAIII